MKEFIKTLDLPEGTFENDNTYTIIIENSNQFDKVYTQLAKNTDLLLDEEISSMTFDGVLLKYEDLNNKFEVTLKGDFNEDRYECTIAKENA